MHRRCVGTPLSSNNALVRDVLPTSPRPSSMSSFPASSSIPLLSYTRCEPLSTFFFRFFTSKGNATSCGDREGMGMEVV